MDRQPTLTSQHSGRSARRLRPALTCGWLTIAALTPLPLSAQVVPSLQPGGSSFATADGTGLGPPNNSDPAAPPSLPPAGTNPPPAVRPSTGADTAPKIPNLPSQAGQRWREYDLRPYSERLSQTPVPEQGVLDWILRQTGTDVWFRGPAGVLNVSRQSIQVYHNDAVHEQVRDVYERLVNGSTETQVIGLRMMTLSNPNWRTRALPLLQAVQVNSPGVEAWLVSKENAAILLAMVRGRIDFRELESVHVVVHNGQSQTLERFRSRNYVQEYVRSETGWPPYLPRNAELQEGLRLELSPLISVDQSTIDLTISCGVQQIEGLKRVNVDLMMPTGQSQTAQIEVPQVVSWQLKERFRWPSDQILLISGGVVATPAGGNQDATLLGQGSSMLGLDRLTGSRGPRADALLMLEFKGPSSTQLLPGSTGTNTAGSSTAGPSRGRY
jgi:hypothetical protein